MADKPGSRTAYIFPIFGRKRAYERGDKRIIFITLIITTLLLSNIIFIPIRSEGAYGEENRLWSTEDWKEKAPSLIHTRPAISSNEEAIYLTGGKEDEESFFRIEPTDGPPTVKSLEIEGEGTAPPQVYPEWRDTDTAYFSWEERVYVGTNGGMLYRMDVDWNGDISIGWEMDISSILGESVSIEHKPIVGEKDGEIFLIVVASKESRDSLHAIKDTREVGNPHMIWNVSLDDAYGSDGMDINQPEIFKNLRDDGFGSEDKVIALTSSQGHLFTLDYSNGSVIWHLEIPWIGEEILISKTYIPLHVKKGDVADQFFYFSSSEGKLYKVPMKEKVDLNDIESVVVEEQAELSALEISDDGKYLWIGANKGGQGSLHHIESEDFEKTLVEGRKHWKYAFDHEVVGKPVYASRNSLLSVITEDGSLHCLRTGDMEAEDTSRKAWDIDTSRSPKDVVYLPKDMNSKFLTPVIMVIYDMDQGGAEGWKLTEDTESLDASLGGINEFMDTFCSLCFWGLIILFVIIVVVVVIVLTLKFKKESQEEHFKRP